MTDAGGSGVGGIVICCADIGSIRSPKPKFGWASYPVAKSRNSRSIEELSSFVIEVLRSGSRVALGFECPLWVPVPDEPSELGSKRDDEHDRAWSATGGAFTLTTGLVQVAWILSQIRRQAVGVEAFLDWADFERAPGGLFIWEAFVSGEAKTGSHEGDARAAVDAFKDALPDPRLRSALTPGRRTRSLIGGALLWSGWSRDLALLSEPCIVIKP